VKTKILAGLVGLVILLPALIFIQWPILDALLVIFCVLAAWELCGVVGIKNLPLKIVVTVAAPTIAMLIAHPFLRPFGLPMMPMMMALGLTMIVLYLAGFKKTTFQQLMFACIASIVVPAATSTLLLVRNFMLLESGRAVATFFVLIMLTCAWLTDAMAYFCGKAFGKRKLCPSISPNKTWAGAVGGVLCTMLLNLAITAMFSIWVNWIDGFVFLLVVVASLVLCPISIMGDLLASTLKRNLGIKDFGNIMPEHGGAIDRCDSFLLVCPAMWAMLSALLALSGGIL